jgi:hypothetical protein
MTPYQMPIRFELRFKGAWRLRRAHSMGRVLALTLALAVCAIGPNHAQAAGSDEDTDGKPRVLILPTQWQEGVSEVVPSKIDEYLKTLLDISGQALFLDLGNLAPPVVEERVEIPKEDKVLKKADDLLWAAKEHAGKGKYYKSAAAFKKAMKAYESRFDVLVDFDKYIDASLGVALSYFYAGQGFEGERALKSVLSHRPDLILDKRKVPKEALEVLEKLQHLQSSGSLCQVRVESNPPGAEVIIDGFSAGKAPHVARNLVCGLHVIRMIHDGHLPFAKPIKLTGKGHAMKARLRAVKVKASAKPTFRSPEPLVTLVEQGRFGPRFLRIAAQVGTFYDLDAIVMGFTRKNNKSYEMATFLWEADKNRVAEMDWIRLDPELADMQVNLLNLEEQLLAGLALFPSSRRLTGPSDIYINVEARRRAAEKKRAEAQSRRFEAELAREAREAERAAKEEDLARQRATLLAQRDARKREKDAAAEAAKQERLRQRNDRLAVKEAAKAERGRVAQQKRASKDAAKQARVDARNQRIEDDRRAREAATDRARQLAADRDLRREEASRLAEDRRKKRHEEDEVSRLAAMERRARDEAARLAKARRAAEARRSAKNQRQQDRALAADRARLAARTRADDRASRAESVRLERETSARDRTRLEAMAAAESDRARQQARASGDWERQRQEELAAAARVSAPRPQPTQVASAPATETALDWMNGREASVTTTYDTGEAWYQKWWVWAGTGVVAAAVAGTVLLLSDDGSQDGFRATASW